MMMIDRQSNPQCVIHSQRTFQPAALQRGARAVAWLVVALGLGNPSHAGEPNVVTLEKWSNVTAGEEITLRFRLPSTVLSGEVVAWSVAINAAIIVRKETAVRIDKESQPILTVEFQLPEGEPKTIVPVSIDITLNGQQLLVKQLWIYPSTPFQKQIPHLSTNQLVLFDPSRTTSVRWEESGLEFHEQHNVDALAELMSGVLVIGEDVSFREYRGLPDVIHKAAQRGLKVLCLSPVTGSLLLSDDDNLEQNKIVRLTLSREDVLTEFDKHLDDLDWRGESPLGDATMQLITRSNQMSVEFSPDLDGWPWLEAEFAGGGRIVVCCFHCIEHWDIGPAPQQAMWHILTHTVRPTDRSHREPSRVQ